MVHPVHMRTTDWPCHSHLLVELFIDAFALFPMGAVWLSCPNLGAWLGIFGFRCTHINYGAGYHTHSKMGNIHIYLRYVINYINLATGEGKSDLLFPIPSIGHKSGQSSNYSTGVTWVLMFPALYLGLVRSVQIPMVLLSVFTVSRVRLSGTNFQRTYVPLYSIT